MIDFNNPTQARQTIERAERVLLAWVRKGNLTVADVSRVLHGDFHWYATFARADVEHGVTRDDYAVIMGAEDREHAEEAFLGQYPEPLLGKLVPEWMFVDEPDFPADEFSRIKANGGEELEKVTVDQ